jgi:Flp pilus assembly protein TadD
VDPSDARICHLAGRVLDRMGRVEEAREMYRRGRELAGA